MERLRLNRSPAKIQVVTSIDRGRLLSTTESPTELYIIQHNKLIRKLEYQVFVTQALRMPPKLLWWWSPATVREAVDLVLYGKERLFKSLAEGRSYCLSMSFNSLGYPQSSMMQKGQLYYEAEAKHKTIGFGAPQLKKIDAKYDSVAKP